MCNDSSPPKMLARTSGHVQTQMAQMSQLSELSISRDYGIITPLDLLDLVGRIGRAPPVTTFGPKISEDPVREPADTLKAGQERGSAHNRCR